MISKNQIKFIHSLAHKKFRKEHNLFVSEGEKIVREILGSGLKVHSIFATPEFRQSIAGAQAEVFEVKRTELERISFLTTPNEALCIAEIPSSQTDWHKVINQLSLFLDNIRDPGNLGTIIRIADWFGIEYVFCSPGCVDVYNPKVVQSTMGSVARVKVLYMDAEEAILNLKRISGNFDEQHKVPGYTVYSTLMHGKNIYSSLLNPKSLIILGNESGGISEQLLKLADERISIPSFGKAESLNVAASAAVIASEFRRRNNL